MTVAFAREEYSDGLVREMLPLWEAHYEEIAMYKDIPLDPDLERYEGMARVGMLRIFTIRDSGSLMGYQVMFVTQNPHYRTCKHAVQDITFLSLALRKGLIGYRFFKWCDEQLRAEGVQVVSQHLKAKHDYGAMLERIGYELQDKIYSRRLS